MRVLLDECVPRKLKRDLIGHDVQAVVDIGWSSKRNGEPLQLMLAQKFDVLLTVDRNLEFQQNVRASGLGVVVVIVRRNRLKELRPLAPAMLDAIARVRPGELIRGEGGSDVGVPSGLKDTETLRTKRTGSDQRDPTGRSELARKTAMIRNAPTSSSSSPTIMPIRRSVPMAIPGT